MRPEALATPTPAITGLSEPPAPKRIPELDGLRGAAIVAVWLGHYFTIPGGGIFYELNGYWLRLGWTGVDLFFVLSGFLIGGILLDVRDSPRYFRTFYARRFFRIIPVYYAWILAYILMITLGRSFLQAHALMIPSQESGGMILTHVFFLQNIRSFFFSPISMAWFAITWSLAVEEQFYLVAPLLVRFLSKRSLALVLGGVIAAAPILRLLVHRYVNAGHWLAYRMMPCRADTLAMGMLAAMLWRSPSARRWLQAHALVMYGLFAVLLMGVQRIWRWHSDPNYLITQVVGYSWIALFFTVTLLLAISQPWWPIAYLSRFRLLRELGGVSYCIYIIHLAVFLLCHELLLHRLPEVTTGKVGAVSILAALLSYGIAKLSWKFFENPLLRRGHDYKY